MNTTDRTRFVEALDLGAYEPQLRRALLARREPSPAPNSNTSSGYVDDGSLVSFVAGLPYQLAQDTLYSTLLAQLSASKLYDRWSDTENWYKQYSSVLENVGWTLQGFKFDSYHATGASFDMSSVVFAVLGAIAFGQEIVAVTATLDALKNLPQRDGRVVLWDGASASPGHGNFLIGTCSHSDGNVVMQNSAVYFKSSQPFTSVLWFKFSTSSIEVYAGAQTMVLNEQLYGGVRQSIVDKLGDRAKQFVADLPI